MQPVGVQRNYNFIFLSLSENNPLKCERARDLDSRKVREVTENKVSGGAAWGKFRFVYWIVEG